MKTNKKVGKIAILLFLFTLLLGLPMVVSTSLIYFLGLMFIFLVYVVSWDIVAGQTGQINLGHTVFIGIGGYTTALLQTPSRLAKLGLVLPGIPIWLSILLGGANALVFGLIIGIVCLRLRGYYLALVTAVLPLVLIQLVNIYSTIFGGYEGFSVGLNNALASSVEGRYYISMLVSFACLLLMYLILKSKIGIKFRAIREDEDLAESIGMNVVRYKLLAFLISAFFAGIAGALMVHYRLTVGVDLFGIPLMLMIILAAIIGGLGNFEGVVLGAVLIYSLKNWIIRDLLDFMRLSVTDEMILYMLLIFLILKAPEGIFHELSKFLGKFAK